MKDNYHTIEDFFTGYFKDKGSRFYAYAYPIRSEEDVKPKINQLKKEHHSARHYCYAWRLGTEEITFRTNDDGEPSSTAGKPILGQLQRFEVTNILVVVVRYFGGTLLGTSGLINAYKNAALNVLENANIVKKLIEDTYILSFTYKELNDVMTIAKRENLKILNTRFEINCELTFSVRKSESEKIKEIFENFYGVKIDKHIL